MLIPVYDEGVTLAAQFARNVALAKPDADKNLAATVKPVHRWVYRPEMQFSLLTLKSMEQKIENGQTVDLLDYKDVPLLPYGEDFNLIYTLLQDELPMLDQFGPERRLVLSMGEHEVELAIGQNGMVSIDWDSVSQLNYEDLLTVQLYQNGDDSNVLWEYKFADIDVDIDSDNDNGFGLPGRTENEEQIESLTNQIGKIIAINDGDVDSDRIPDYADFNIDASGFNELDFVPVVLELPLSINPSKAKVRFLYSDSDPTKIVVSGTSERPKIASMPSGKLRLWKTRQQNKRIILDVKIGGHYISSYATNSEAEYSIAELGGGHLLTFYVEGIKPTASDQDQKIVVQVDPNWEDGSTGFVLSDVVKVYSDKVDLDIDSDNDGVDPFVASTVNEDIIENVKNDNKVPGKLIPVNDIDSDGDGIPNFADFDGISLGQNESNRITFAPMIVTLPSRCDYKKAKIKFVYSESDPSQVIRDDENDVYYPAPGSLRIWSEDGYTERNVGDINRAEGHYVKSNTSYGLDKFEIVDGKIRLYLEGVRTSLKVSDLGIKVEVDINGDERVPSFVFSDNIRETIYDIGWIDEKPEYARSIEEYNGDVYEDDGDSDNFFLRKKDFHGLYDYEELDIWYNVLPIDLPVVSTHIDIKKKVSFDGEFSFVERIDSKYSTGEKLHSIWTPELANDPIEDVYQIGFWVLELNVEIENVSKLISTSITDADEVTPGWQCPQNGLAIHDLIWKHRPIVYLGLKEVVGPPQHPFNEVVLPGLRHKNGKDKIDPDNDIGLLAEYDEFGEIIGIDYEKMLVRSSEMFESHGQDMEKQPYLDLRNDVLRVMNTDSVLFYHGLLFNKNSEFIKDNYLFIQFWMYQPSSHGPYTYSNQTSENPFRHEGDWEMCQLTLRLLALDQKNNKSLWVEPFAATASQHYYGQTLIWDRNINSMTSASEQRYVMHGNSGNRVKIYIAENAHATYFRYGNIDAEILAGCGTDVQYGSANIFYDRIMEPYNVSCKLISLTGSEIIKWPGQWGQTIDFIWEKFRAKGPESPEKRSSGIGSHNSSERIFLTSEPVKFHQKCINPSLEDNLKNRISLK